MPKAAMPEPAPSQAAPDWESFYASYRKPGYVPGYEITSKLGGGMFGLVFRARKQSIGKDYALKFLKVDDAEVRRAIVQELEQVRYFAQVDHPNLVSIEDRGEVDGIPYLVMNYAGSETLKDRLPCKAEERDELLRYFLQACRGVSALHERSLVHFDLKPANVFLKGGVARVGDYGLSKLVTHSRGSLSMGRGTPYYMAPEMLQRRGDQRSDVYSLGVMLYEILAGEVPFRGDSEWEVLRKHEREELSFPASIGPRERAVLARCLAKDPDQRYQRVDELVAALGGTTSAGAAAWQDVRAGAGAAAAAPRGADPYSQFQRAAREAAESGAAIARQALEDGTKAVRSAAAKAGAGLRTGQLEAHSRWRQQLHQLRQQRRIERERRREERRARRRNRSPGVRLLVALGWFGVVGVCLGWCTMVARVGPRAEYEYYSSEVAATAPAAIPEPPRPPSPMERDLALAELAARLAAFEAGLPASPEACQEWLAALPPAPPVPQEAGRSRPRQLQGQVEQLVGRSAYDEALASRLRRAGQAALQAAAQQLGTTPLTSTEGLQAAGRLHRFLVEATGFEGIRLYLDEALQEPLRYLAANRAAVEQWQQFLREFARDQATWARYQELRRR